MEHSITRLLNGIKVNLILKLSDLQLNFTLTLGYLKPALDNPALIPYSWPLPIITNPGSQMPLTWTFHEANLVTRVSLSVVPWSERGKRGLEALAMVLVKLSNDPPAQVVKNVTTFNQNFNLLHEKITFWKLKEPCFWASHTLLEPHSSQE